MKRAIDLAVATPALLVTLPLMAFVAVLIRARLGSPVLFRQLRPGEHGRPFEVMKFRTMTDARDRDGRLLPDQARLSTIGTWLRTLSVDELPQLLNVMRGDLSLVGPRPLLMQYMDRYTPDQARRHDVKPGITGWAQINGRNALTWEQKFALDTWYVDHWSLRLDLLILVKTLRAVVRRSGISSPGSATMPEFMGTRSESR